MKLSLSQSQLQAALAHVQGVVENKPTMPILSHVLLKTVGTDKLRVWATDLDLFMQYEVEAQVGEGGMACVRAKELTDVAKQLDGDQPVELEIVKATRESSDDDDDEPVEVLRLAQGRKTYDFPITEASDFPNPPNLEKATFQSLPVAALKRLIRLTLFAAAKDDPRVYLNGVHVELDKTGKSGSEGILRFVATDGHRLAVAEEVIDSGVFSLDKAMIVPRKALGEVFKILEGLDGEGGTVELAFLKGMGALRSGLTMFTFRLIDGNFPDYRQVIPKKLQTHLTMGREAAIRALKRLSALAAADQVNAVALKIDKAGLVMKTPRNTEKGRGVEPLEGEYTGEEAIEVGYNYRFVLEVLEKVSGDKVMIGFNDAVAPTMLTVPGDDHFRCVIMPLDLNSWSY